MYVSTLLRKCGSFSCNFSWDIMQNTVKSKTAAVSLYNFTLLDFVKLSTLFIKKGSHK